MLVPPKRHIAVNLVRNHQNAVSMTEMREFCQCLPVPNYTGRVMRIRQDEHLAFLVSDLLEILEIHGIRTVRILAERIHHHFPIVSLRSKTERMIYRRLDDNLLVRLRKHIDNHTDTLYDTRDVTKPLTFHFPSVMRFYPVDNRRPQVLRILAISQDWVL